LYTLNPIVNPTIIAPNVPRKSIDPVRVPIPKIKPKSRKKMTHTIVQIRPDAKGAVAFQLSMIHGMIDVSSPIIPYCPTAMNYGAHIAEKKAAPIIDTIYTTAVSFQPTVGSTLNPMIS
jgi:hypothetical protein